MDEAEIEAKADDLFEEMNDKIDDWSEKDQIEFWEQIEASVAFRLRSLRGGQPG
jgi:hypothetical protein